MSTRSVERQQGTVAKKLDDQEEKFDGAEVISADNGGDYTGAEGAPYPLVPVHPDVIRTMNEEITLVLVRVMDPDGDVYREIVHINTTDGLNLAVVDPVYGENDAAAVEYISALFDLTDLSD